MADLVNNICDLCEEENCGGPIKYAHKPYFFHFYHEKQYKQALEDFHSKEITKDNNNSSNDDVSEEEEDEEEGEEEEEEEYEDENEEYKGEDEDEDNEEDQEEISEGDILENDLEDEEREVLVDNPEDNYEGESVDENDEMIEDDREEEIEGEVGDGEEEIEEVEEDQQVEQQINKHFTSGPAITSVVSDVKTLISKTLDFTMAAGVGIMAGIASMTSGNEYQVDAGEPSTSFINLQAISKTCIGTALAAIGMVAGVKEIVNALNERPPALPVCEHCKKYELQQPGCQTFCESCGECEQGSYWKDGIEQMHCLKICNDCNTNCVVCEEKVATVRRHHKAFTKNVHGQLSTRLYGTYKDARIFGSSLIIAGIISCVVPGISWSWGITLVAGSVIANSGIRIVAKPIVRIRCDNCNLEEEAEIFEKSAGCQRWCQCCGVEDGTGGEKYCLALCEDCSHD